MKLKSKPIEVGDWVKFILTNNNAVVQIAKIELRRTSRGSKMQYFHFEPNEWGIKCAPRQAIYKIDLARSESSSSE